MQRISITKTAGLSVYNIGTPKKKKEKPHKKLQITNPGLRYNPHYKYQNCELLDSSKTRETAFNILWRHKIRPYGIS